MNCLNGAQRHKDTEESIRKTFVTSCLCVLFPLFTAQSQNPLPHLQHSCNSHIIRGKLLQMLCHTRHPLPHMYGRIGVRILILSRYDLEVTFPLSRREMQKLFLPGKVEQVFLILLQVLKILLQVFSKRLHVFIKRLRVFKICLGIFLRVADGTDGCRTSATKSC